MWLSKKAAEVDSNSSVGCKIGVVSVGGVRPSVLCDGEARSVLLGCTGGAVFVPRVGDEVLLEQTADDERVVIGRLAEDLPEGLEAGDVYISAGSASIYIRNNGRIEINGSLFINGAPYVSGE